MMGGSSTSLVYLENGDTVGGVNITTFVERHSLGIPFKQDKPPDISSWKFCREIWPRFSGDAGTVVSVSIGSQVKVGGAVTWDPPQDFIVGQDDKLNCTISGRLFALRFESVGLGSWVLNGYDLEVDYSGGY